MHPREAETLRWRSHCYDEEIPLINKYYVPGCWLKICSNQHKQGISRSTFFWFINATTAPGQ